MIDTKLQKLIQEQLKQVLKELAEPEAELNDPFGQYLFGSARKDEPASEETDTSLERRFYWSLDNHISENDSDGLNDLIPFLLDLKKQGKYSKFLEPPSGKVYRVIKVPSHYDAAGYMLGTTLEEIQKYPDEVIALKAPTHTYTPRKDGQIASWSTEPENLYSFIPNETGYVAILLEADTSTSGEFLLNPNGLLDILPNNKMYAYLKRENEVISVGPVQVTSASFYYAADWQKIPDQEALLKQLIQALKSS